MSAGVVADMIADSSAKEAKMPSRGFNPGVVAAFGLLSLLVYLISLLPSA
jgi:hypothetical protein